jgi:hypothetical protein
LRRALNDRLHADRPETLLRTIILGLEQRKAFGSHNRDGKSLEEVPDRGLDLPGLPVTTGSELRGNRTRAAQN